MTAWWKYGFSASMTALLAASAAAQTQGEIGRKAGGEIGHRVVGLAAPKPSGARLTVYREELTGTAQVRKITLSPEGRLLMDQPDQPPQPQGLTVIRAGAAWEAPTGGLSLDLRFRETVDGSYGEPGRNWDELIITGPSDGRKELWFNTDLGRCSVGVETPAPGLLKSGEPLFEMVDLQSDGALSMRARLDAGRFREDTGLNVELKQPELAQALRTACAVMAKTHDLSYEPASFSLYRISARVNEPALLQKLDALVRFAQGFDALKPPFLTAALKVEAGIGNAK